MSAAQQAGGLLEHDGGTAGPDGPGAPSAGREVAEEVMEEVEDFLEKLVADVVDKVDEAPPPQQQLQQQAPPAKVGVVPDADMENLRDLLDNLLDDNMEEDQPADVCQQTGAAAQLGPTEDAAAAAGLPLPAEGGAGTAPQRPWRQPGEAAAIDAAAAGLGVDEGRKGRKGRTASRTRRRKQRTARSRSTRSSRSRSSRSRDAADLRSRSRHKHSRKHKRRRRHHRSSAPLMLNVDSTACSAGPVSPRVNPVFLWVKQEECRILSVVCEDYDRRNRLTLTKTNNGWRAIPKTERFSAVLGPRPSVEDEAPSSGADGEEEEDLLEDEAVPSPADDRGLEPVAEGKEESQTEPPRLSPAAGDSDEADPAKDKCTKDEEQAGADMLDELCKEAAERMEESCQEALQPVQAPVAVEAEAEQPSCPEAAPEAAHCSTAEDSTDGEAAEDAPEDDDKAGKHAEEDLEGESSATAAEDLCKEAAESVDVPSQEEEEDDDVVEKQQAHEPCHDTSESMEESRKDAEEIMAELCKELAQRKSSEQDFHHPKDVEDAAKQEEKVPSRPCSVFDLLNLDETEHVVRLPADLEVSLVGGAASPKPSPRPSPRPSSRQPSCSPEPAIRLGAATTITPIAEPAKQHKFLESLLASPRKSDLEQQELPLDLASLAKQDDAPPAKKPKLDDLTLRHLLNRLPGEAEAAEQQQQQQQDVKRDKLPDKVEKSDKADKQHADKKQGGKSRLLELLSVPETVSEMDPLAQLKRVLSDPDLVVPDPLLVPRARLQALVTSPAQEIPRLLAQGGRTPAVPHAAAPSSQDADVCVVSLSHLQSLLQPESKQDLAVEEYQRRLLEAQMLWLPYLEAAYAYPGGYLPGYDYQQQMELQSTLAAAWQETMLKGGGLDAFLNNNNNYKKAAPQAKAARKAPSPMPHVATPRHLSAAYDKQAACKYPPSLSSPTGYGAPPLPPPSQQQQHRTSRPVPAALPINSNSSNNLFAAPQRPYQYQQQQQQQRRELEKQQRREYEKQQQLLQRREYEKQQQQRAEYEKQQEYHQQLILLQQLQLQQQILAQQHAYPMAAAPRKHSTEERPRKSEGSRPPTCKSLLSMLSAQREASREAQPADSALLAALGGPHAALRTPRVSPAPSPTAASSVPSATATAALPGAPVLDLSGNRRPSSEPPSEGEHAGRQQQQPEDRKRPFAKLKVKNLVDPNAQHRLLKLDTPVAPPPAAPPDDVAGNHLWHPLFSSQKSYNSPWQWTTVTVNGE